MGKTRKRSKDNKTSERKWTNETRKRLSTARLARGDEGIKQEKIDK